MTAKSQTTQIKSDVKTFTITSGNDGSSVDAVDLGANYDIIVVKCESASNIQADTTLGVEVGYGESDTLVDLYSQDLAAIAASGALPTSGGFAAVLSNAAAARRVRIVLSANASGGSVVFKVQGFHRID